MRRRARLRIRQANNPTLLSVISKIEKIDKDIKTSFENESKRLENEAVSKILVNTKYFYSFANNKSSTKERIVNLKDSDGNIISDKQKMCDILQDNFISSFSTPTEPSANTTESPIGGMTEEILTSFSFSADEIIHAIKSISNNAAAGKDGITPKILKECSFSLCRPLHMLWTKSLDSGTIPDACKHSIIVPIHKKKTEKFSL